MISEQKSYIYLKSKINTQMKKVITV